MDEHSEIIILDESGVRVTNKRAILGGKTYAMANVTSVSMTYEDKKGGLVPFVLIVLGLMIGGCVFLMSFTASGYLFWAVLLSSPIVALPLIGLGVLVYRNARPKYFVRVGSSSGEVNVLESYDKAQITRIVQAINKAIISG